MNEWISVDERLPDLLTPILVSSAIKPLLTKFLAARLAAAQKDGE
jgi:hypothetical protein